MKVSLSWLQEFVELPASVPALCDLLTKAGVEVEKVETRGCALENVVVAQILESARHPNADRLSVCKVADGQSPSTATSRQIVCGAKNYKVGDKVPLALPGAVLPGDFKIKVGKLRGVESQGMLCSGKELGIDEDAAGLLILPPESEVGAPISALFPPETILEVEITPNRPDLLSHLGMAKEIAALLGKPLKVIPALEAARAEAARGARPAGPEEIALEAPAAGPFYSARKITGVKVGPSPAWLKDRLESVGLRSVNNIVDITNFVLMETGQPLHAFDLKRLAGGIRVRFAAPGESLPALDGKTYPLAPHHLVIADHRQAKALAGVMGGEESGVSDATTEILLESALFAPSGIRRTSRELGLASDASYHYERGVDPAGLLAASARATRLILELAGGAAEPQVAAAGEISLPDLFIPFRLERCRSVLGAPVTGADVERILTGFGLQKAPGGWRRVTFRPDLAREIDLIEEVARVIGIEAIPSRQAAWFSPNSPADRDHDAAMAARRFLAANGFFEARSLTLISDKSPFAAGPLCRVRNPMQADQGVLRPSLLPGLCSALARNLRAGQETVRLFEVGRVFQPGEQGVERTTLALLWSGANRPASWRQGKPETADFFDLKGLLESLPPGGLTFEPLTHPALALGVELRKNGKPIGLAGVLQPSLSRELDATLPVLVAELDLDLLGSAPALRTFQELPKFPAVTRDIALSVPEALEHRAIEEAILGAKEPLLSDVRLFDLFVDPSGEKLAAGQKSLAYALTYRSRERTLTSEEVTGAHGRVKAHLQAALGAQARFRE